MGARVRPRAHVLPGMLARKRATSSARCPAAGLLNHVFAAPYGVSKAAALSLSSGSRSRTGGRHSCLLLCPRA